MYSCEVDRGRGGTAQFVAVAKRTEDAGHDCDAGVFGGALGILDAQSLQRRQTDGLVSARHFGRRGVGNWDLVGAVVLLMGWRSVETKFEFEVT